jgi:hypothetical protein
MRLLITWLVNALALLALPYLFNSIQVDDIRRAIWEKFVFLVALSGTTTLARQPIGGVRSDPDLRAAWRWPTISSRRRCARSTRCRPRCARRC